MKHLKNCSLCPRNCHADRRLGKGFCKAGEAPKIARAALHYWEEPCISGNNGSGTVFFSGCNLNCVYCQNYEISSQCFGKEISVNRLAEIFLELQAQNAHNINLVSPTPYIPQICAAIDLVRDKMHIPFVYNTGGYEKPGSLRLLKGYVDIYLTDIKYFSGELAKKYSGAENYFNVAISAAEEMIKQTGAPKFLDDGIMKSGVIIRHLVLPGCRKDSEKILNTLAQRFSPDDFILSIMSQFTPSNRLAEKFPELCRKVTTFEYSFVTDTAIQLGFTQGYMQQRSSAEQKYTPPFDLSGV
ncbi:MAG: radical SAM protein [Clostridia bacterium]|nr:radical SAM protein [Clostridia bacterium]